MSYGVTTQGFVRKRLDDIKLDIENRLLSQFGDVNLGPDSVLGQFVGVMSKVLADEWEVVEQTYYAMYPNSAEGISLDNSLLLIGIERIASSKSRVIAAAGGIEGTLVEAGKQAVLPGSGNIFEVVENIFISSGNAIRARVYIVNIVNSVDYVCLVNLVTLSYESSSSATLDEIGEGIAALINDSPIPVTASYTSGDDFVELETDDFRQGFNLIVDQYLSVSNLESPVEMIALNVGPIAVPINTLTQIQTPVAGWNSINNYLPAVLGRNTETDPELRIRRKQALRVAGAATVESIRARLLQDLQGVTGVTIFENRSIEEDSEGRPGKSFEVIISGGDDQEIVEKIWELKPAGIETFGNIERTITDSMNLPHQIFFSRAVPIYLWVSAEITLYDEEIFPQNGLNAIKDQIMIYGNSLGVGDDVIVQRFFGFIFQIPGIATIDLKVATSETAEGLPGAYSDQNLEISAREIAELDLSRVGVTIV